MTALTLPRRCKWRWLAAAGVLVLAAVAAHAGAAAPALGPVIGGCAVFPPDNVWNTPGDDLPVDPLSATYVATIGAGRPLHPDFGSGTWEGQPIGIPFAVVPADQAGVAVTFQYDDESDHAPYPVPTDAPIEGGAESTGDRHVLLVQRERCVLYELYSAQPHADGSWAAGSGAIFPLDSQALRPAGWTSADAAGLPILAGLVRYDEVAAGHIDHAIRFTAPQTRRQYVWPARHYASSLTGDQYPPMGQRFRLKADFDTAPFPPQARLVLEALKKYGMILADNGSSWFISGAPDQRWDNEDLAELRRVAGASFEAVDQSGLMVDPDSAQARTTETAAPQTAQPTVQPTPMPPASPSPPATAAPGVTSETPAPSDTPGPTSPSPAHGAYLPLALRQRPGAPG
jgi:hypothetical protein